MKFLIFDSGTAGKNSDKTLFTDRNVFPDRTYRYSVIPYFRDKNRTVNGEEFFFEQVKTPSFYGDGEWWKDIFS